ncbi:MAG: HAMP domain-containing sensor histidine kinase, partial [Aliihoeflea sp.]
GRLGGGIGLNLEPGATLRETLTHVIDESRAAWPDNRIEAELTAPGDLPIDHQRIAQLLSNLIGNAITHGEKNGPVRIEAGTVDSAFCLSVFNHGDRIPDAVMAQLFQPFARGKMRASQQGLGLGLYISSEIARAHGGRIDVASDAEGTRFTFSMPLQQPAT